jgi:hypothetical protein
MSETSKGKSKSALYPDENYLEFSEQNGTYEGQIREHKNGSDETAQGQCVCLVYLCGAATVIPSCGRLPSQNDSPKN